MCYQHLSLSKKFGHTCDTHMRWEEPFYATWSQTLYLKLGNQQAGIYEEQLWPQVPQQTEEESHGKGFQVELKSQELDITQSTVGCLLPHSTVGTEEIQARPGVQQNCKLPRASWWLTPTTTPTPTHQEMIQELFCYSHSATTCCLYSKLQENQSLRFLTANNVWALLTSISAKSKALIQLTSLLFQVWVQYRSREPSFLSLLLLPLRRSPQKLFLLLGWTHFLWVLLHNRLPTPLRAFLCTCFIQNHAWVQRSEPYTGFYVWLMFMFILCNSLDAFLATENTWLNAPFSFFPWPCHPAGN